MSIFRSSTNSSNFNLAAQRRGFDIITDFQFVIELLTTMDKQIVDMKPVIFDNSKSATSQSVTIRKDVIQAPKKKSTPKDEAWGPLFLNREAFIEKHYC